MSRGILGVVESLLEINRLDVKYGHLQVLWDISFRASKGEVVCLIGANGAGKTTILNTIAGLVHPANGSIKFDGKRIDGLEPFNIVTLGISMVPEGRRILPEMTVLENLSVATYPKTARRNKEINLERVFELFPRLRDRRNQSGATLSGGEQQMLAIGRALMSEPNLILFDEISLGLAPIVIDKMYDAIGKIRERGITVVLVEQNTSRSLQAADRVYVLNTGHVVLQGEARNLKEDDIRSAYFGVQATEKKENHVAATNLGGN